MRALLVSLLLSIGGLAVACIELLLAAPLPALLQIAMSLGAYLLLSPTVAPVERSTVKVGLKAVGLGPAAVALASVCLFAFVFLGTWARQWMSGGTELERRPEFGTVAASVNHLVAESMFGLELVGVALLVATLAVIFVPRVLEADGKGGA